tara:strand:- start:1281 stop:2273 length:993 start_codon:yes stop_codon:yes gene_type:complete
MNISILIPTKDRVYYICRLLFYYDSISFKGNIIILDSSGKENSIKIKKYYSKFNLNIEYFHSLGYPGMIMKEYMPKVKSDYIVETGDDDFLIINGLEKCINFLNHNLSYSAVHGKSINILSNNKINEIDGLYHYEQCISLENKPSVRLYNHMKNYRVPNFSVFRRKTFEDILKFIPSYNQAYLCPDRQIVDELIQSCCSVICTKVYEINNFYLVRQITPIRNNVRDQINNINKKEYELSLTYLKDVLFKLLQEYEDSKSFYLQKIIFDSIDNFYKNNKKNNFLKIYFIGFISKIKNIFIRNYNLKYIEKNIFYKDYIVIKKIIKNFKAPY